MVLCSLTVAFSICVKGQNNEQGDFSEMMKLDFMVGDWVGVSRVYEGDTIGRQGPVFESIRYLLDSTIITIDLHSTMLQLHTVIYYNEVDKVYYYCPYFKGDRNGTRYIGNWRDGNFLVNLSEDYRLTFEVSKSGELIEFGEKFSNGKWSITFRDVLGLSP